MKRIIIALCMLYLFGGNLSAKVVLPQILSDHAVLQQQTEVMKYGLWKTIESRTPSPAASPTTTWVRSWGF